MVSVRGYRGWWPVASDVCRGATCSIAIGKRIKVSADFREKQPFLHCRTREKSFAAQAARRASPTRSSDCPSASRDEECFERGRNFWFVEKMTISARNILKGRITRILDGAVNCEITLEVAPGIQVVSIITKSSTESLGLAVGDAAYAVIKASDVMIAIDG